MLREHGVDVSADVPGVGENLQDHVQPRQMFRVSDTVTLNEKANSLFGRVMNGARIMLFRSGPCPLGPATLTAFTRSDPTQEMPNIQYHVVPATYPKLDEPPTPFPGFTSTACILRPTSRGYVRIRERRRAPIRRSFITISRRGRTSASPSISIS